MCWINRHPLEHGTAAFLDGEGLAVCAERAAHVTVCTGDDCDHPRYAYAAREGWAMAAVQALAALYIHAGLDLESRIALLHEAALDGEAPAGDGYLGVGSNANEADPRFSIRESGSEWL